MLLEIALEVYTRNEIENLIRSIKDGSFGVHENIDLFVGPKKDQRLIVKPGLKVKHQESGVVYVVVYVDLSDMSDPRLICNRPGVTIEYQNKILKIMRGNKWQNLQTRT